MRFTNDKFAKAHSGAFYLQLNSRGVAYLIKKDRNEETSKHIEQV